MHINLLREVVPQFLQVQVFIHHPFKDCIAFIRNNEY